LDRPDSLENKPAPPAPEFAHPSEAEFARFLDFYGIAWEYEPRTFVLEQDADGNVLEAFSPDFYLPEQDLYVEMTTIRQKLITKKNRKLRRLQELYPDVNIKLFNRRDFRTLLARWGMSDRHDELIGQEALDLAAEEADDLPDD
jgi:hypoxanthine phosphoribosyltransferase